MRPGTRYEVGARRAGWVRRRVCKAAVAQGSTPRGTMSSAAAVAGACWALRQIGQRPSTTPQGDLPTATFLMTCKVAVSTMLTSFDEPFAV